MAESQALRTVHRGDTAWTKERAREWFCVLLDKHLTPAFLEALGNDHAAGIVEFELDKALRKSARYVKAS